MSQDVRFKILPCILLLAKERSQRINNDYDDDEAVVAKVVGIENDPISELSCEGFNYFLLLCEFKAWKIHKVIAIIRKFIVCGELELVKEKFSSSR